MDANWALVGLTFVLILVTGYYAWQNKRLVDQMRQQNEVARDGLRVQLYDRRAAILGAVRKLVATALESGDLPLEIVNRFAADVGAAPYLLDQSDASIISEMIKRSIVVGTRAEMLRRMVGGTEKDEMQERQMGDFVWLEEQAKNLVSRFKKYLNLSSI